MLNGDFYCCVLHCIRNLWADKSYIKFGQEYITAQLQNTVGFLDNNIRQLSYFELMKI